MRFEGEKEALSQAVEIGSMWGYGNVIQSLRDAWSTMLQKKYGLSKQAADAGAGYACPWCNTDERTGIKAPAEEDSTRD